MYGLHLLCCSLFRFPCKRRVAQQQGWCALNHIPLVRLLSVRTSVMNTAAGYGRELPNSEERPSLRGVISHKLNADFSLFIQPTGVNIMSFFDSIKKMGKDASAKISNEVAKFKNKDFLNAVVSGCALVAAADGSISSAEKQKMLGFINSSDELKVFGTDEVIAAFNNVVGKFDFDFDIGKAEALKVISKIKSDVAASKLMIRVCCIIGASDGTFDETEKAVVAQICRELGVDPAEFDLK